MKTTHPLKVAYLAGTSYCGSTLMALLMDSHPQIASVGETSLNRAGQRKGKTRVPCTCGEILLTCPFWQQIFQSVNQQGFELSVRNWTNDYKYKNPLLNKLLSSHSSNPVIRRFQHIAASVLPIHRTRVQRTHRVNVAFMQSVLNLTGAEVFFDASKGLARLYHLLDIPELDIQVIRMVRDVRAFANSFKRKGRTIADAAKHWKYYQLSAENLTRQMPSHKVFLLRYEALCQNPKYWLQSLYDFLGVEVVELPEMVIPQEHHILGNRRTRLKEVLTIQFNESWRETLTEEEVALSLRIAGEINERCGYKS